MRYEIYVEEMGYASPGVNHRDRRLAEPVTRPTRLLMAEGAGALVGALQFNWSAECAFSDAERRIYRLSDFVAAVDDEAIDRQTQVIRDDRLVALLTRGGGFGEIAFLRGIGRTADVVAVGEAKIISLRERTLNELIAPESRLAARFLLNLARIGCLKLATDDQPQR